MKKLLYIVPMTLLGISLIFSGCHSPFGSKSTTDTISLDGSWKMTPETSTLAVSSITKDHPILFSFDLQPDSSATLYFVNSNGQMMKTGTWSKKPISLTKTSQVADITDLLIYYADSTHVMAIGYQLKSTDDQIELISHQKEHYQRVQ